jgi:hypothetical protein
MSHVINMMSRYLKNFNNVTLFIPLEMCWIKFVRLFVSTSSFENSSDVL